MKRFAGWCALCLALSITLILASAARAQTARTSGTVLDFAANPWPGVTVTVTDPGTSQKFTAQTDKDGKFSLLGLHPGTYDYNFHSDEDAPPGRRKIDYTQRAGVTVDGENILAINFKEIAARPGATATSDKIKADEQDELFKSMKTHFTNGATAMAQVTTLRTQLAAAPADQKSALKDQIKTQCTTAASEFELAERGVTEKDVKNHAVVLGNLGVAYECLDRFADATAALQKAVDMNPTAASYSALATNLVKVGIAQINPKNADAQLADLYSKAADDCA